MSRITAYCHINLDSAYLNGRELLTSEPDSEDKFLKQLYKHLKLSYPKFYKMDQLAQAGFLAFEMLRLENQHVNGFGEDEVAMVFANKSSSSVTDLRFQESYTEHGAPSPSLFVYTLPNIVMGELAILNKWYGENIFAVLSNFAPEFYMDYFRMLSKEGTVKALLGGWLEVTEKDTEVFLFLVEAESGNGIDFTKEALQRLHSGHNSKSNT